MTRVETNVHKHVKLSLCCHLTTIVLSLDEGHFEYLSGTPFPTDFYFNGSSLLGERILNITHCNIFSKGR
jgi:hypothetical protein